MQSKAIKQRKCASCKELFTPSSSLVKVCGFACALDYGKSVVKVKKKKEHVAKKKTFLDNDKSFQKAKAQKSFNEFIRVRDANLGCISCDKPSDWGGQWHAGHYKTVGARPDLRFNEDNVHKQCSQCNNFLSGNMAQYRIAIIAKIGSQRVLMLETDSEAPKKYTASDYAAIYAEYTEKVKKLKNDK